MLVKPLSATSVESTSNWDCFFVVTLKQKGTIPSQSQHALSKISCFYCILYCLVSLHVEFNIKWLIWTVCGRGEQHSPHATLMAFPDRLSVWMSLWLIGFVHLIFIHFWITCAPFSGPGCVREPGGQEASQSGTTGEVETWGRADALWEKRNEWRRRHVSLKNTDYLVWSWSVTLLRL